MPTNAGQHPKSAAANASISIGDPKAEAFALSMPSLRRD
jgi:hypothetical protein